MDKLYNHLQLDLLSLDSAIEHLYDKEKCVDNKDLWKDLLITAQENLNKNINNFLKNF